MVGLFDGDTCMQFCLSVNKLVGVGTLKEKAADVAATVTIFGFTSW